MTDATTTWTEERVERLKALWQDGKSASFIAAELGGVTRNAVIGKVHRLGLSGRGKPQPQREARPRAKAPAPVETPVSSVVHRAQPQPQPITQGIAAALATLPMPNGFVRPVEPATRPASEVVVPISERVTIMDLRESMCRWPLGDPSSPDFRFCGARARAGIPYCDCHAQIAYQPSAERRRERKMIA